MTKSTATVWCCDELGNKEELTGSEQTWPHKATEISEDRFSHRGPRRHQTAGLPPNRIKKVLRGGQEPGPNCKLIWDPPGEGLLSAGAASIVPLAGGEGLEEKELWAETPQKAWGIIGATFFLLGPKSPFWISRTSTILLADFKFCFILKITQNYSKM